MSDDYLIVVLYQMFMQISCVLVSQHVNNKIT